MYKCQASVLGWWPAYILKHLSAAAVEAPTPEKLTCVKAKIIYGVNIDHGIRAKQLEIR
jgi:hypothetical protein